MRRLLALLLLAAGQALAQQAQIRIGADPYYVDVPVEVQVIADGFERDPEPSIKLDAPDGATLQLLGVSPSVSTSIQIINGKMTREERVRFVYRYQLLARQPGEITVGPAQVTQGATRASTRAFRLAVQAIADTAGQRFRLVLPDGPFWVGQRVPVTLEWWLSEEFAKRLAGRRARVPLFDYVDRFSFQDRPMPDASNVLRVDTASGPLDLPVAISRGEWDGKPYVVVTGRRTLIALKSGEVQVEPASMVAEEAVRWSRDFFGKRVPSGVRSVRVSDQARTLVFRPPPLEGRPASFAGAVGKGFSIQVSADRSVVQAGDPVRVSIDIGGDADLDNVSLPDLTASGLPAADFKVPQGPVAGTTDGDRKRFEVTLRVNHDGVREIPPIELSWFDPELGRYESTRSRPIAVSVRAATLVSAEDVVTGQGESVGQSVGQSVGESDGEGEAEPPADPATPVAASARPAFTLSGAELAIETDTAVLGRSALPFYGRPDVMALVYLGSVAMLGLGLVLRRRAAGDPALRTRRRALTAQRQALSRASGAGELARVLRQMAAASPPGRDKAPARALRSDLDALLVECDNLAYAPGSGEQATIDPQLRTRALAVADALLEGPP